MKTIHKTFKYRLKPIKTERVLLDKHFGCTRYVYNYSLSERKVAYEERKESLTYSEQSEALKHLKREEETSWLKEVNSQSIQHAVKCVDVAYKNWYSGRTKHPRFKSRRNKNSFHVPQNVKVEGENLDRLNIPKFKTAIKMIVDRPVSCEIRNATLTKTASGKYFVSIMCITTHTPHKKTGKKIGGDLGLTHKLILSNGVKYQNHRYTKRYEKELAIAQEHLSRKKKGSRGYEKQRLKVAMIHEKLRNCRKDNLHKITTQLVKD